MEETYFKDFRSLTLKKDGGRHDWPLKTEFQGRVAIRISTDNPVKVSIMGPHAESAEVRGDREFTFTADPGTEFRISAINEQRGLFAKDANVTIEVEMRGPKKAIELINKIKNYHQMLSENPDFYSVIKDGVQDAVKQLAESGIWGSLSGEHKNLVKELTALAKKLET